MRLLCHQLAFLSNLIQFESKMKRLESSKWYKQLFTRFNLGDYDILKIQQINDGVQKHVVQCYYKKLL